MKPLKVKYFTNLKKEISNEVVLRGEFFKTGTKFEIFFYKLFKSEEFLEEIKECFDKRIVVHSFHIIDMSNNDFQEIIIKNCLVEQFVEKDKEFSFILVPN